MRYLFAFIFCLAFTLGLPAQAPKQFLFTPYDVNKGLPSNRINDMVQDQEGFLWLATAEGLARFDGVHCKLFRSIQKDQKSYPFSFVHQLHLDQQQRLWLLHGYWEVGYFDTKTFRYTPVELALADPTLKSSPKGIIHNTGKAVLLGVASTEILVFDEKKRVFKPAHDFFPRRPDWKVQHFWRHPKTNQYGAYITGKGAMLYDRDTKRLHVSDSTHQNLPFLKVLNQFEGLQGVEFDDHNRIWLLRWNGRPVFSCYDLQQQKFVVKDVHGRYPETYHDVSTFFMQKNGTFWVSGGSLLAFFDETKKQFVNIPSRTALHEAINYSRVLNMFEDREQNLWVGTENNGLYRFNPSSKYFSNVGYPSRLTNTPSPNSPLCYLEEPDGSILVAVWAEGFYRYDRQFNLLPTDITINAPTPSCWDVCLDQDPNFAWFGAQPGVCHYDQRTRQMRYYNPAVFKGSTVRQVEMDPSGNLWFGTQSKGVFKWNRQKGKVDFEKGLYKIKGININRSVNQITIDSYGWVWIATGEHGMFVVDSETDQVLMHFQKNGSGFEQISEPGVSQVLEYNDSLMVFATSEEVLLFNRKLKKTREIVHEEEIMGLISTLQKDQAGNIWMGTLSKLYRFHPHKPITLEFDHSDGIFDESFNLSAAQLLSDGRIIMGCDHQFIVFDPKKLKSHSTLSKVRISDISINNEVQPLDSLLRLSRIDLSLKKNNLNIDFSALTFDNFLNIQYKLEGLDQDWVNANQDQRAAYNYIPPGTYRFLLRTINSEMVISPEQYQFSVKIYPPFYRASWFYALLLLVLVGTVLWFDAERMRRKEAIAEVRNKIANDLHQEVNTTLQNINILSEMANLKADQDPQKSKEFMAQIQSKSHHVIDAMNDMLWGIAPENDSMKNTLLRMEEQVERLQNRHDAQIDLLIEGEVKYLKLDMRKRYGVFLLFKEGVKGMLNVCPQGYRLHVFVDKKDWVFTAYCEQKDYDTIALNNLISRSDLRQRILALNAHIQVNEEPLGFTFEFRVPVEN
jgi:ligand-binding sensor domain-containing protein